MLIDETEIRNLLSRVVCSLASDAEFHDDLMQEALIHLWQEELQRPGQTQSWYIQSCRFHLQNYLARGRSIDSMRHRHGRFLPTAQRDLSEPFEDDLECDESFLPSVSAHDMMQLLSKRIKPFEQTVLGYLADGFGVREIAQKLRVSHQAVSKHRQKIASLAVQLGISLLAS